jgi:hypothetical protein
VTAATTAYGTDSGEAGNDRPGAPTSPRALTPEESSAGTTPTAVTKADSATKKHRT